jgi:hypothetical protein
MASEAKCSIFLVQMWMYMWKAQICEELKIMTVAISKKYLD